VLTPARTDPLRLGGTGCTNDPRVEPSATGTAPEVEMLNLLLAQEPGELRGARAE